MLFERKLKCSFCGKSAAQVAKLVAGRRGYICDVCAAGRTASWRSGIPRRRLSPQSPSIGARITRFVGLAVERRRSTPCFTGPHEVERVAVVRRLAGIVVLAGSARLARRAPADAARRRHRVPHVAVGTELGDSARDEVAVQPHGDRLSCATASPSSSRPSSP